MSATGSFSRWAKEIANDPRYPVGLARDEETVALYVAVTEALAEAPSLPDGPALAWIPSEARRRHFVN
jgi:hypothetical protein